MNTISVANVEISPDHWIGGERVSSAGTFDDISPIAEQVIGQIARGGPAEASAAVGAAAAAFPTWAATAPAER
ncbi:MAG: aldehyde dehydrogenase family protein, partial [Ilumatobacteraceae bacterium]